MPTLELVLRIAAFSALAILVPTLLLHRRDNRVYHYGALLLTGIAAYFLAPLVLHDWQWGVAAYPVILLAIIVPALFWYFSCAVFVDDFHPHKGVKWLVVATAAISFLSFCSGVGEDSFCPQIQSPGLGWLVLATKLMWVASAFFILLKEWRTDLVESRRQLRVGIVVAGGLYIGTVVIVELFLTGPAPASLELLNISLLLLGILGLCFHILGINETNVLAAMAKTPLPAIVQRSALADKLEQLMAAERIYATEALTINGLAQQLGTQPYLLRKVINDELGHRNFNAFVNLHRIEEIAARMRQDEFRDTPLLTLALDAGFRSLAPFNRSFKAHFGLTPSEYRQQL
jgi:AraC-like DNA-binding protein